MLNQLTCKQKQKQNKKIEASLPHSLGAQADEDYCNQNELKVLNDMVPTHPPYPIKSHLNSGLGWTCEVFLPLVKASVIETCQQVILENACT